MNIKRLSFDGKKLFRRCTRFMVLFLQRANIILYLFMKMVYALFGRVELGMLQKENTKKRPKLMLDTKKRPKLMLDTKKRSKLMLDTKKFQS